MHRRSGRSAMGSKSAQVQPKALMAMLAWRYWHPDADAENVGRKYESADSGVEGEILGTPSVATGV